MGVGRLKREWVGWSGLIGVGVGRLEREWKWEWKWEWGVGFSSLASMIRGRHTRGYPGCVAERRVAVWHWCGGWRMSASILSISFLNSLSDFRCSFLGFLKDFILNNNK